MQCKHCGHDNPDDNNFCGSCGYLLAQRQAAAADAAVTAPPHPASKPIAPPVPSTGRSILFDDVGGSAAVGGDVPRKQDESERVSVSGPSFLGLADSAGDAHKLEYLYEDEPSHWGRVIFALLLLAGFAVFLAYEWKQFPSWYATIVKPPAPPQAASITTPPAPPLPPGTAPVASTQAVTPAPGSNAPDAVTPANGSNQADPAATPKDAAKDVAAGSAAEKRTTPPAQSAPADEENADDDNAANAPAKAEKPAALRTSPEAKRKTEADLLLAKGQAYLYGKGVPKSCSQALVYLRNAADMSNPKAYSQLGALYATGHCVPLDRARAYNWFTKSKNAGSTSIWVDQNRQMLWSQMTPAEKERALKDHMY